MVGGRELVVVTGASSGVGKATARRSAREGAHVALLARTESDLEAVAESIHDALVEATTSTGGALLGSTLTSAGPFSALLLHPRPQFQSFGTLVVLAMVTSFVVAVFVLPRMLTLWARYGPASVDANAAADGVAIADD